jgi:hypothetical protein
MKRLAVTVMSLSLLASARGYANPGGGAGASSTDTAKPRSEAVAMAQERVLISSDWGKVTAELVDNNATRSLVQMLPLTIEMRDHLRQEKTGNLPSPLPEVERQVDFSTGTLGLWSSNHFVIYYRDGRVPQPGIILLGRVTGDVSIFDRPGPVTVRVERSR